MATKTRSRVYDVTTVPEVAEIYGLHVNSIYQAIDHERIHARRSGSSYLMDWEDVVRTWGPRPDWYQLRGDADGPVTLHTLSKNEWQYVESFDTMDDATFYMKRNLGFTRQTVKAVEIVEITEE